MSVVVDCGSQGKVFVNPLAAALPQSTMRRSSSFSKLSSSWTSFNQNRNRQAKWGRLNSAKSNASTTTTDDMAALMFEIEDTGSSIDAEHREAMFQNFVSLPNSSTRYGGTGVGLGIVRSLIELMGGQIEVVDKSSPGALFRFTVTLKVLQHQVDVKEDESDSSSGDSLAEETHPIWAEGSPVTTPNSTLQMHLSSPAHHHKYTVTTDDVATEIQARQKVVLGMPDGHMQAEVAARWFKHHGCHVSKVSSWKCMQSALDSFWHHFNKTTTTGFRRPLSTPTSKANEIESAQRCDEEKLRYLFLVDSALITNEEGTGPALQQLEFLGRDIRRRLRMVNASVVSTGRHGNDDGHGDADDDGDDFMMPSCLAMVLLTTAATPPPLQRAAKSAGFKILQKPLVPSRLMPFLKFLRGMGNLPSDTRVPRLSSQNGNKVMGLLPTAEKPIGKLQSNSPRHKTSSSSKEEETWWEDRSKVVEEGRGSSSSSLRQPEMSWSKTAVTCSNVNDAICSSTKEEVVTENTPQNLASPTTVTSMFSVGLQALLCVESAEAEGAPKESLRVVAEGLHHNNLVPLPTSPHRLRPQGDEEEAPSASSSSSASASAHTPGVASSTSNDNKRLAPTPGLAGGPKVVGGLRVLLVEDTSVMAQIARKQLEKMGASVWWAQDGQIAVEMFASSYGITTPTTTTTTTTTSTTTTTTSAESSSSTTPQNMTPPQQPSSASPIMGQPFDVIVMDCQMPRLDGYGATAAIRHLEISLGIRPRTPIIALTAHAMTTDRKKCLDAGMDEYLAKPLNVKLLQAMLEKLLGPRDDSS